MSPADVLDDLDAEARTTVERMFANVEEIVGVEHVGAPSAWDARRAWQMLWRRCGVGADGPMLALPPTRMGASQLLATLETPEPLEAAADGTGLPLARPRGRERARTCRLQPH